MLKKSKYRASIIKALFPFTRGIRKFFVFLAICTVCSMALSFLTPLLYKQFIDKVILGKEFSLMKWIVLAYLLVFFFETLLGYFMKESEYSFIHKLLTRVKGRIFEEYLTLDLKEYDAVTSGERKKCLDDDTAQIREFTGTQTINYLINYIKLLVSIVLLFFISWKLTIFAILTIPLTFFLDDFVSKIEKKLNKQHWENEQQKATWLQASLHGWREVKALDIKKSQQKQFLRYLHIGAKINAKWINCWTARIMIIPRLKNEFLIRFAVYFLGGLLIIKGKLGIGSLLAFVAYFEMMSAALMTVSTADAELQANMSITDRFLAELRRGNDRIEKRKELLSCPTTFTGISMEHVDFVYEGTEKRVLDDFSLEIKPGERVALKGRSGCGKSTILKLMTGMLTPARGLVTYSGVDMLNMDKDSMYHQIGFVMQENILFHLSIRENLRYGKSDANEAEMKEACKRAGIYDFINSLPEGLDTVLGEKGLKLSGGQRQRIVLARLFLRDVNVYIFDEATSALDQKSETFVQDSLSELSKEKTIIVVAHRESSIRLCDRVVNV